MAYERNGLHNPNVIDTVQKKVLMNRKQLDRGSIRSSPRNGIGPISKKNQDFRLKTY